jgi:hypothetical protein
MAVNAFASSRVVSLAPGALGTAVKLESFPPFHDIEVSASSADGVTVGDVIVRMAGRRVPRRLTSDELLEGVRRRAAAADLAGAAETSVDVELLRCASDGGDGWRVRCEAAAAHRECVLGACGAASVGGRDVQGLRVVADGGGSETCALRKGDVIICVDDVPCAPGARPDLARAETVVAWRPSDFIEARGVLDGATVDAADAARYRTHVACLGLEFDAPACVTVTRATPCGSLCLTTSGRPAPW